jgi:hypothetical protein
LIDSFGLTAFSTKNKDKARDAEMHQSKKGNQWYFGMKADIGVGGNLRWCAPTVIALVSDGASRAYIQQLEQ